MPNLVNGIVQDGVQQAQAFTQLAWVRQQFRAKFGFEPYPGTLNVCAQDANTLTEWRARPGITIEPATGFCAARCYRVRVNGIVAAAWIIPDVAGYADDLIELIAPVSLRETLALATGDRVTIELME